MGHETKAERSHPAEVLRARQPVEGHGQRVDRLPPGSDEWPSEQTGGGQDENGQPRGREKQPGVIERVDPALGHDDQVVRRGSAGREIDRRPGPRPRRHPLENRAVEPATELHLAAERRDREGELVQVLLAPRQKRTLDEP